MKPNPHIRRQNTARAAEALSGLLGGMESGARIRESLALAYWERVVGPQAAAASEAESVRDGVLFVRTKSSVWSHELTFLKSRIISELNRRIGGPMIKEVIFRAQGVTKRAAGAGELGPTADELAAMALSADEQAALERDIASLGDRLEPAAARMVTERLIRDRKLRTWRLQHGWKVCARCTALHDTENGLCPICRVCR